MSVFGTSDKVNKLAQLLTERGKHFIFVLDRL